MIDAYLRFARSAEQKVPPAVLIVAAGLVFVSSIIGIRALDGSSTSPPTGEAVVATSTSTIAEPSTTAPARSPIPGFTATAFTITQADGTKRDHCGLLAANGDQRAKGLMNERDLNGYDGMLFVFDAVTSSAFYMANVPAPLQVAWFDDAGTFVSGADMPVCTVAATQCPLYRSTGPYRTALETFGGGMGPLQVGSGSVLSVGTAGSCT